MCGLTCRVGAHNSRYAHDTRLYPTYIHTHVRSKLILSHEERVKECHSGLTIGVYNMGDAMIVGPPIDMRGGGQLI